MVGFRWPYFASATQEFAIWSQRLLAWYPPTPYPAGYTAVLPALPDASVYDAIFVLAHALKQLLETEVVNPTNGHATFTDLFKLEQLSPTDLALSAMSRAVRNVSFLGPSGLVKFDSTAARASVYEFCHGGFANGLWWCRPWGMWTEQTSWLIMPGVNFTNGSSTPVKDAFAPSVVGFISVNNVTQSTVTLSWAQPELNFGRDVTYNLRLRVKWAPKGKDTGNYSSSYSVMYSGTQRSFMLHDLPDGAVLEAQVETVTHAGTSSFAALTDIFIPTAPSIREISVSAVSAAGAFASVGSAVTVAFMIWMYVKRDHPVVRASSLLFCQLVLLGTLVAYQSIGMLSLSGEGKADLTVSCAATPFLLQTAFALVFVSMFAKTYRLYRIFFQKVLSVQLRLTDRRLLMPVLGYVAFGLIVNTIWSSKSEWRRSPEVEYSHVPIFPGSVYTQSVGTRHCHDSAGPAVAFWCILLVPNLTLMGLFMVVSFRVRSLAENFNESRYIAMALWNFMFIMLTSLGVASSNLDPDTAFLFHAAAIWAMCLSTTLILFLPKVFAVMTWNSRVAPSDTALTGEAPTYGSHSTAEYSKSGTDHWTGGVPHGGRVKANSEIESARKTIVAAPARRASVSLTAATESSRYAKPVPTSPSHSARAPLTLPLSLQSHRGHVTAVGAVSPGSVGTTRQVSAVKQSDQSSQPLTPGSMARMAGPHESPVVSEGSGPPHQMNANADQQVVIRVASLHKSSHLSPLPPSQRVVLTPLPPSKPRSTEHQQYAPGSPHRDRSTSASSESVSQAAGRSYESTGSARSSKDSSVGGDRCRPDSDVIAVPSQVSVQASSGDNMVQPS